VVLRAGIYLNVFNAPTSRHRSARQLAADRDQQRWVWEMIGGGSSGGGGLTAKLDGGGAPPSAEGGGGECAAPPSTSELLRRQRSASGMTRAISVRNIEPRLINPDAVALSASLSSPSLPLRHIEVPPGPLGLRFQMCDRTGHARVDIVLSSSPLVRLITAGDLLVAVDEVATRELGASDKVSGMLSRHTWRFVA
jgi:hypothetical protein